MVSIGDALRSAADKGIITAVQADRLEPYLLAKGAVIGGGDTFAADGTAVADDALQAEESEQPRFVRGFHDILITIGVIVALVGLWGIGSLFAVLPAIIILAEILIRRQRLALPAVALTVALAHWTGMFALLVVEVTAPDGLDTLTNWLLVLPVFAAVLAVFYWRYRVPLALAATLLALFLLAMDIVLVLLAKALGSTEALAEHSGLAFERLPDQRAGHFFGSDVLRYRRPCPKSRQSDVAFWLHLAAAPALLYAMLSFIFLRNVSSEWWGDATSPNDAAAVLAIVVVFMMIGLIIDRRAFVTSGLVSLGLAIWTILQRGGVDFSDYFSVTVLAVGVVVLMIGIFWQVLRRAIVTVLPAGITSRLHPIYQARR
ncbi:hypothetical protein LP421_27635 [Rhizobium sp. RCAM05350]|nr:hypothetical protein LP421_27635 [Rhizobium sp. RCAM05350]